MKGTMWTSWITPRKRGEIPNIEFRLSVVAWIQILSSKAWFICSWDQPSDFLNFFTGLSELVAIFLHLSWGISPILAINEIICWLDFVSWRRKQRLLREIIRFPSGRTFVNLRDPRSRNRWEHRLSGSKGINSQLVHFSTSFERFM